MEPKQIKEIYDGFKNLIFPNEEIEALAEQRLSICFGCKTRTEDTCDRNKGGCGCFLPAKIRSKTSACPKGYWGGVRSNITL